MAEMDEPPAVGRPLTAAQTASGILLTLSLVAFAGQWAMFAGNMERTAESETLLEEIAGLKTDIVSLEAQIEALRRPVPSGPIETGGALVLTDPPSCERSRL